MNNNTYIVKFSAAVTFSGDIQITAKDTDEAKNLARKMLRQNLNKEDCLIEIGENNENITIREIFILPNVTALDVQNALILDKIN